MKAERPLARRKLMFCGSIPSATYATLTPAPVMPSERAVWACGEVESVLVVASPSGSSNTAPLVPQAPGITCSGSDVGGARPPLLPLTLVRGLWIATSGITAATAALALRRGGFGSETLVAIAFTSRKDFTRGA